jgi:hypothetical protein
VVRPTASRNATIDSTLARLRAQPGYRPVMGESFAADLEEIVRSRRPADRSAWD